MTDVLCRGTSLNGSPCVRYARKGTTACSHHDPERAEARALALEALAARVRAGAVR